MRHGYRRLTSDEGDGQQREKTTPWKRESCGIGWIWSWQCHRKAMFGCHWHSAIPMKMWWWCFYRDCVKPSPINSRIPGEKISYSWWTAPRTTEALQRGPALATWGCRSCWVHRTATRPPRPRLGSPTSREGTSTLKAQRRARGK